MNTLFKYLLLLITLTTSLHGCTFIPTSPASLNTHINQWLDKNEFDKIDNALLKIDTGNKQYSDILNRKDFFESRKKHFINLTVVTAKKHQKNNKWQLALDTYDQALKKIKAQPKLEKEKSSLLKKINEHVTSLGKKLLLQRANALISYKEIYLQLNALIPRDYNAQFDIKRYDKDRLDIARQLKNCGDFALKNKQYIQAKNCYSLSNKLNTSEEKRLLVERINKQLKQKTNLKRSNSLLVAYKIAYKNKNYTQARAQLKNLLSSNPLHTKAKTLLDRLNAEIKSQVEQKIHQGELLYNDKKINEALQVWKQALRLDPKNKELNKLIDRAEKVSKNIQNLQRHQ